MSGGDGQAYSIDGARGNSEQDEGSERIGRFGWAKKKRVQKRMIRPTL